MKSFRVLLVDNAPDRKKRISLLTKNGLVVRPALNLQQARERCKPGRYDLVIVNGGRRPDLAVTVCDDIITNDHEQILLLMVTRDIRVSPRSYLVASKPEILLDRVKTLLAQDRRLVFAA